jgi:hypothetical protein
MRTTIEIFSLFLQIRNQLTGSTPAIMREPPGDVDLLDSEIQSQSPWAGELGDEPSNRTRERADKRD